MKLTGRVLRLYHDPARMAAAYRGTDPQTNEGLAYGVSTDDIIDAGACTLGYDEATLGPHLLKGFRQVIPKNGLRERKIQVLVAGEAYGSGSSREAAVVAHRGAGIELVVARSFQRIFQENMVYAGLPFTSDFSVLERLEAQKEVDTEAIKANLPPLFRAIAASGGLLKYAKALFTRRAPPYAIERPRQKMNLGEKLIAQNVWRGQNQGLGVNSVRPGEQVLVQCGFRGFHEYTAGMVFALYEHAFGDSPLFRPEAVAAFEDHFVLLNLPSVPRKIHKNRAAFAGRLTQELTSRAFEHNIKVHGPGRVHKPGICHRLVLEEYAAPGQIVILTDSHSPTAGALNAFAFGVGSTAMAFALKTGLIPVTVPKVVRVELFGTPHGVLSPKDLILHLIGDPYFTQERWRCRDTDTCMLEFGGPALAHWNVDELSVLTNMSVEGGMMTGVVEPCAPIQAFLDARRESGQPAKKTSLVGADLGAHYAHRMALWLDDVPLTVAVPPDPRRRMPLSQIQGRPVHNVVVASCTGASLADLRQVAQVWQGRVRASQVRITVTPSSARVAETAHSEGLLDFFRVFGAEVTGPGCGACIGNGPGVPRPGETTVSTTNRNFEGRMGAPGPVYLVSPSIAAAAAVTGHLGDPRALFEASSV